MDHAVQCSSYMSFVGVDERDRDCMGLDQTMVLLNRLEESGLSQVAVPATPERQRAFIASLVSKVPFVSTSLCRRGRKQVL
ncbi:hypothetical protein D3227_40195 [Mesorhizobium waimense]|uniref:Uncharacterized protein n=1 Tax=Mesorhizobium waimense TaxID=1300307 RepID=A0A3A5JLW5_9HYPH|nr:hypothetical protein D3227_40195 [Mesorhizobium waimense]